MADLNTSVEIFLNLMCCYVIIREFPSAHPTHTAQPAQIYPAQQYPPAEMTSQLIIPVLNWKLSLGSIKEIETFQCVTCKRNAML